VGFIWQDGVFAIGTFFLAVSTLPIILNKDSKVPRSASLLRSIVYLVNNVDMELEIDADV
jgi:hypothetical protein